jgi:hypothetical protein
MQEALGALRNAYLARRRNKELKSYRTLLARLYENVQWMEVAIIGRSLGRYIVKIAGGWK